MAEQGSAFAGFFAFFAAYSIVMLVAFKVDPRFSLKPKKATSAEWLLGLSAAERLLLTVLLIVFSLFPALNIAASFGFDSLFNYSIFTVIAGFFFGALTFFLGMAVNGSIMVVRKRLGISATGREKTLARLVSGSSSRSKSELAFKLVAATLLIAVLEELIFRGYLMYYLAALSQLSVALVVQAFVYFSAYLYQGLYKGLLALFSGLMFGVAFFFTGSLLAALIAHLARDLVALSFQFYPKQRISRSAG